MNVEINAVSKHYGKVKALEGLSLSIPGGMFGLLGPNGAGKTTLMRIITTLIPLTAGQVKVDGVDVMKNPQQIRESLGYLPQGFGFYKNLRVWEMLDYIAGMKNVPNAQRKNQIEKVLAEVNLTAEAGRKVGALSGGMKQRLGIAQALLGDPRLMVVDEPTAGLDPEERVRFRNLFLTLAEKRTVLLSTHIVADIEASCSGIAVIYQGRLVFSGQSEEMARGAHGRVWSMPIAQTALAEVANRYQVVSSRQAGHSLVVRVLADHQPSGDAVLAEPALEDGYLALLAASRQGDLR